MKRALVALLLGVLTTAAPAAAQTPNASPIDVNKMWESINGQYSAQKGQIAKDVVRDPQTGAVRTDDAAYTGKDKTYRQIETEVRALDAARRQQARQLETVRSGELGSIARDGGVDPGTMKDTGTAPGEATSRGIAGDRDITLGKVGDVNKVAAAARAKHFTVEYGKGYIRIKELNTVIWDPPKPRGLSERVAAANDAEFAPAKTVNAQIKKGMPYLGNPPKPGAGDADIGDWTQNVAKSVLKAGDVTGADPATQDTFARIKAGHDPEGSLYPVGASPAEKTRALQQFNDRAVSQLGDAHRKSKAGFEEAFRKLDEKIAQAGNDADAKALRQQRAILAQDEAFTEAPLYKKNPEMMYEIAHGVRLTQRIDPKTGNVWYDASDGRRVTQEDILAHKEASVKRLTRAIEADVPREPAAGALQPTKTARTMFWAGVFFGTYHAYEAERQTAEAERRDISWGAVGWNSALNILGVNGAIQAGKAVGYETQQGMREYVQQEIDAYRKAGGNPDDPDFKRWLIAKAQVRATALGTYEALKGFPLIGDLVAAPEATWNLQQAQIDYFDAQRNQLATEFENFAAQASQEEAALDAGRRLGAELTRLAAEINAMLARLATLVAAADAMAPQAADAKQPWAADDDALRRVCDEMNAFAQNLAATPSAQDVTQLATRLTSVTREAGPVCQAADRALADQRLGAINAQGFAFRVENGIRAPLSRAEADYNAARPGAEALLVRSRQADALFAKAAQTDAVASQHATQVRALAERITKSATVVDDEVNRLMASAQKFNQLRGQFFDGARHFYANATSEPYKVELRQVAATVSTPTIDQAAALQYSRRAQALRALATELASLAGNTHPPCAALPAFVAARDQLKAAAAPMEAALAQATDALANGRACLARATAPMAPPPTASIPPRQDLAKVLEKVIAGVDREQSATPVLAPPSPPPAAPAPPGTTDLFKVSEVHYPNGQLWSRTSYYASFRGPGLACKGASPPAKPNACKHGPETTWFPNGQKEEEGQWVDGQREGLQKRWCENGRLRLQFGAKADRFDGSTTSWRCDTGTVSHHSEYREGRLRVEEEYWDNGQKKSHCEFSGKDDASTKRTCSFFSSDGKFLYRK